MKNLLLDCFLLGMTRIVFVFGICLEFLYIPYILVLSDYNYFSIHETLQEQVCNFETSVEKIGCWQMEIGNQRHGQQRKKSNPLPHTINC